VFVQIAPGVTIDIDRERLGRTLQMIVGERTPLGDEQRLGAVAALVERELRSYGLHVESDFFSYRDRTFRNIVARHGAEENTPLIIVGAHLDSVPGTPGADDNASGLGVLLETARIVSQSRISSQVLFCAFNLEELNMIGSTAFAKKLKAAGVNIELMISLEMVGYTDPRPGSQKLPAGLSAFYPDRGDFIGVIGNWRSHAQLRKFSRLMREAPELKVETLSVPARGMLIPAVRLSDHAPFWDLGYPALMITDTAFYRNPHYHRPTDTLDTLDLPFMVKVCEGVARGVIGLAGSRDITNQE
jgi:Zn-dependent M28 family amino/carboxypeptidase